ncbi:MAG: Ig-like domain-containing protein, partial [Candidatus Pacearchaeota archaeon]|nr:Ig-like domain-containing protein [Candidatus Pacearchaeota archaeon]
INEGWENVSYSGEWYRNNSIFVFDYWNKTYGGNNHERAYSSSIRNDSVYLTGSTHSFGAGWADIWTIKLNSSGDLIWNRTYGTSGDNIGYGVYVDNNEEIYVTGVSDFDLIVLKYDSNGNLLWNKTFGEAYGEYGYGIYADENYVYVTGEKWNGTGQIWILKLNSSNGGNIWNRAFDGSGGSDNTDLGYGIVSDKNGNIYVVGEVKNIGNGRDGIFLKYNQDGNLLINKSFGGTNDDLFDDVVIDDANQLYVTGYTRTYGQDGYSDVWTLKLDSNGNLLWNKTYGGGGTINDAGYGITIDRLGNVYVAGRNDTFGNSFVLKYDSNGNFIASYGLKGNPRPFDIISDKNNNIYPVGYIGDFEKGEEYYINKQKIGFFKENQEQGIYSLLDFMNNSYTDVFDVWRCCARASSKMLGQTETKCSNNLTILNITDIYGPNITIIYPANGTIFNESQYVNFSVNVSDVYGIQNITFYIYNTTGLYNITTFILGGGPIFANVGVLLWLAEGVYYWWWEAYDWIGNFASTMITEGNRTITIDVGYPKVYLNYPNNGVVLSTRNILFNISASDNFELTNCTLWTNVYGEWKANETKNFSGNYDSKVWNITNISNGNYVWNAYCCDKAGNCAFNRTNYSFSVAIPRIRLDLIYPKEDINVSWRDWFNISLNVSCYDSNCGEVNVSLDPEVNVYVEWNKTIDFSNDDVGYSIVSNGDGTFVLTGSIKSGFNTNVLLAKINSDGNLIWNKTFDYNGNNDIGYSLIKVNDGYVIAGSSDDGGWDSINFWVIKTDFNGNRVWNYSSDNPLGSDDVAYSIVNDSNGYVVVGKRDVNFNDRAWIIKLNSAGNEVWNYTWGYGNDVEARSVVYDNGYVFVGSIYPSWNGDIFIAKINSSGVLEWNRTYDFGGSDEKIYSIEKTPDGGFIATGYYSTGGSDVLLVKFNSTGGIEWSKTFDNGDSEIGESVIVVENGYVVVDPAATFGGAWILKTDNNGNLLWNVSVEYNYANTLYDVAIYNNSYFAIGSTGNGLPWGNYDLLITKINEESAGEEECKTGLVSMVIGEKPFYTNESNPRTINLDKDESKKIVFWVNATGDVGTKCKFYAFANKTSEMSISNSTPKWNVTIDKAISRCYLSFDKTSPQNYGNVINASCYCTNQEASAKLYRNGIDVTSSENNKFVLLGAGNYNYVCNVSATQNYTNASNSSLFVINKAPTTTNLFINGNANNLTISYGTLTNVTAITDVGIVTLYRDGNIVNNPEIRVLSAGIYNYSAINLGNENYSSSNKTLFLTVNKAIVNLAITILPSNSVDVGTETNVSGSGCPEQLECRLYRNNENVTNPNIAVLTAGNYNYVYNTTGNANYTNASVSAVLSVVSKEEPGPGPPGCSDISWNCGEWGGCVNNKQERTCVSNCNRERKEEKTCCVDTTWTCSEWTKCIAWKQERDCLSNCNNARHEEKDCECVPNWNCSSWSKCENGIMTRDCDDLNNCNSIKDKPITRADCRGKEDEGVCEPNFVCGEWMECEYAKEPSEVLRGMVKYTGERKRICKDIQHCANDYVEKENCLSKYEVVVEGGTRCGERKLFGLGRENNTIFEINAETWKANRLDVIFMQKYALYCDWCYNGIRDYDEEGIDCGGSCKDCPVEKVAIKSIISLFKMPIYIWWIIVAVLLTFIIIERPRIRYDLVDLYFAIKSFYNPLWRWIKMRWREIKYEMIYQT